MSTIRFVEVAGERIVLGDAQVQTEARCDECGQFMESDSMATADITTTGPDDLAGHRRIEAHPSCLFPAVRDAVATLLAAANPF